MPNWEKSILQFKTKNNYPWVLHGCKANLGSWECSVLFGRGSSCKLITKAVCLFVSNTNCRHVDIIRLQHIMWFDITRVSVLCISIYVYSNCQILKKQIPYTNPPVIHPCLSNTMYVRTRERQRYSVGTNFAGFLSFVCH